VNASRVRPLRRVTSFAVLALLASQAASSDPTSQVPVGARAIGMGGAYTSLADDATALFWNPAGLVGVGHQELAFSHANLFGTGIQDNIASFVLPLSTGWATALDWYHSGFSDSELGVSENRVTIGTAFKLRPWLSAGANAKLLTRGADLDGQSILSGRAMASTPA
jgi:hypothetical protein